MNFNRNFVALSILLFACPAFTQDTRARVLGTVRDPAGAAVAGATVSATNTATNVKVSTQVNEAGLFDIPYLLPGAYDVTAEAKGFKTFDRRGLELRISDRVELDIKMEVGQVSDTITVSGATSLLEVASASTGSIVDHRNIVDLPVSGGNALTLARLTPGVTNFAIANHPYELTSAAVASRISVSGMRSQNTEFTVDGTPAMSNDSAIFVPPADLVQEVKTETNSFDAASGHSVGGYVNTVTRSGANIVHGSLYEFHTDASLKGLDFFQRQRLYDPSSGPATDAKAKSIKGADVNNRFGGSMSGPVVIPRVYDGRNKAFWIFGYEGFRHPSTDANSGYFTTVPTVAERKGDLSALLALGSIYQIYDPATITPAGNGRFNRSPFPGNIIPASRLDAAAQNLLNYYPLPNTAGTATGLNNYFSPVHGVSNYDLETARIDENFSDKHRFFARFNYGALNGANLAAFRNPAVTTFNQSATTGGAIDDVYIFSPALLIDVRYGFTRAAPSTSPGGLGIDLTMLDFSPGLAKRISPLGDTFPTISIDSGTFTTLGSNQPTRSATNYQVLSADLTRYLGQHSLRFGGDFRVYEANSYTLSNSSPSLSFATAWTQGPLDNSPSAPVGQGLASFLLGLPTSGSIVANTSYAFASKYFSGYLQDDWKVNAKLTLNLGIRYEYETAPKERYNRSVEGFNPTAPSPNSAAVLANYSKNPVPQIPVSQFQVNGGLTFAGLSGNPSGLWHSDNNNFAPRIGLAYQLNPKTVIRGGYGVFYMPKGVDRLGTAADRVAVNQTGFSQVTSLVPTVDNGQHFIASLENPFPNGIQQPVGASAGLLTSLGQAISYYNSNQVNPLAQRWDIGFQRELPGHVLMEAMYVGSSGSSLAVSRQLDPIPAQYLSTLPGRDQATIDLLSSQVPNPFYPLLPGTSLSGSTVSLSQLLRPFPQFTGITYNQPIGSSIYHALDIRAEKRFAMGFSIQGTYSFSKFLQSTEFLNATDAKPSQVISDQDIPERAAISGLWDLPIGQGRFVGRNMNRMLSALIGGWQIAMTWEGQSGIPLGFGDVIFNGDIHNITLPGDKQAISEWFNVNAGFDRNPADQRASDIRTMSLRFPSVRGQGLYNANASGMKYFRITERTKFQLRVEMMNAFNHSTFAAPNTTVTSTLFGQLTQVSSVARQIFFAGKLIF